MPTVTKPPILDSTGQAIVTALGNVSIRPQIVDNCTTADSTKALSANQGKVLNDYATNIKPSLGIDNNSSNTLLQTATNANDIDKTSVLYTLGVSNLPSGASPYGYLTTLEADHTIKTQTYNAFNSPVTYKRICNDGNWGGWMRIGPMQWVQNHSSQRTPANTWLRFDSSGIHIPPYTGYMLTAKAYYNYTPPSAVTIVTYYDDAALPPESPDWNTDATFGYRYGSYAIYPNSVAIGRTTAKGEIAVPFGMWGSDSGSNTNDMALFGFLFKWTDE